MSPWFHRNRPTPSGSDRDIESLDADEIEVLDNLERVNAVYATGLMDTAARPDLDEIARQAAKALDAPVALMTLVDDHRQFFAGRFDDAADESEPRETPLDASYCKYVVMKGVPMEIADAQRDPLVRDNPATRDGVRSYLGVPLKNEEGQVLGSFCVVDRKPREWSAEDLDQLEDLAGAAMHLTSTS